MNSSADTLARLIAMVPNPSISPGKALVALVSMIEKPAGRTSPFLTTLIFQCVENIQKMKSVEDDVTIGSNEVGNGIVVGLFYLGDMI